MICNTLKEVRMQVAKANDIRYAPTECQHEGDCAGTCPKCESEVRWLEQQLQLRRQLGKAVAVVGVSVGLAALTACNSKTPTTESDPDTVSIESQTAGFVDKIPDTLSVGNRVAESTGTDQNEEQGTPSAVSQAVEPVYIDDVTGEVLPSPSFPGGQSALINFMNENKKYPEQARKDSIQMAPSPTHKWSRASTPFSTPKHCGWSTSCPNGSQVSQADTTFPSTSN